MQLAASSASGSLTRLHSRYWPTLRSCLKAQPGLDLPSSSLTWRLAGSDSSRVVGLRASVPCWMEAALSTLLWQLASTKHAIETESSSKMGIAVFCNLITEMISPQCCHILLVRSKLLREKGLHKAMKTKRWGYWEAILEAACNSCILWLYSVY